MSWSTTWTGTWGGRWLGVAGSTVDLAVGMLGQSGTTAAVTTSIAATAALSALEGQVADLTVGVSLSAVPGASSGVTSGLTSLVGFSIQLVGDSQEVAGLSLDVNLSIALSADTGVFTELVGGGVPQQLRLIFRPRPLLVEGLPTSADPATRLQFVAVPLGVPPLSIAGPSANRLKFKSASVSPLPVVWLSTLAGASMRLQFTAVPLGVQPLGVVAPSSNRLKFKPVNSVPLRSTDVATDRLVYGSRGLTA